MEGLADGVGDGDAGLLGDDDGGEAPGWGEEGEERVEEGDGVAVDGQGGEAVGEDDGSVLDGAVGDGEEFAANNCDHLRCGQLRHLRWG